MDENEVIQRKWYEKHWVIWLLTIFLAPIGLFLMWRYSRHGLVVKIIATVFFGGAFLVSLVGGGSSKNNNIADTVSTRSSQTATSTSNSNSNSNSTSTSAQTPQKSYSSVDISEMMNDLNSNAAAAQRKYKGQNLAVTGQVQVIDSDGDYISITESEWDIIGVQCFINKRDKAQKDFIYSVSKGQVITVYGKITDVGEVLGYSLKVDRF